MLGEKAERALSLIGFWLNVSARWFALYALSKASPLPSYRCYFLDREDHVTGRTDFEARSLSDAIDQARRTLNTRTEQRSFEIWQGTQRLHPERREKDIVEQAAKRLEGLLGSLAGKIGEPRPHRGLGRRQTGRVRGTPET